MFNTKISEEGYISLSSDLNMLHFQDGKIWIPIETTMIGRDFYESWSNAATSLNMYLQRETANIYNTLETQATYPPVNLPNYNYTTPTVPQNKFITGVEKAISNLNQMNYQQTIAELKYKLEQNPDDTSTMMKIASLHAIYDEHSKAISMFNDVIDHDESNMLAYYNAGNAYFLMQEYEEAIEYFEKAYKLSKDATYVSIMLAKAHYAQQQYEQAKSYYDIAVSKNPKLQKEYAYLGSTSDQSSMESDVDVIERKPIFIIDEN
jgi:tetratricopeptide (TPR) repeat protein